jgi:peptidyl-prolyl cis-trans isomerase D
MATLEKLRNRAGALVAIVIGLALFAFILGDILGSGPSLFTDSQFEIAEIAGKSVSYQSFQQRVDELTEIYMLNTGQTALDSETHEMLREQAWHQLLREVILEREYERLGIDVSPEEMFDMVQGANVHPYVRQLFTDPATGEFNQQAVLHFLRAMRDEPTGQQRAYWLYVENEIAQERRNVKYNNLISKGLYVTGLEAMQTWQENNRSVDFDFVVQRFNTVDDNLVNVTSSDIRRYYRQNRQDFRQTASRDIEFVTFDITPSGQDSLLAQQWIEGMVDEFGQVEELRQFISLNSDVPYDARNYSRDQLPESIADFMFNAREGDIYGPYFENNSYRLSKLAAINMVPDSVRARHILIQPGSQLDYQQAENLGDSIMNLLRRGGDFQQLAIQYSDDTGSRFEGGNLGWFTADMMVPEFSNPVFQARRGEIIRVETQFGIHIVEVTARSREVKKVQVATLAREVTPGSRTYQQIYSRVSRFAGQSDTYERFTRAASEEGIPVRMANNLEINDRIIPGLGGGREVIRWAFEARKNAVSQIFEIGDRFVIAAVTEVRTDGYRPLEAVREEIEAILIRQAKAEIIAARFEEKLRENMDLASIADQLNTSVNRANNISFSSITVPGAGIEPRLIATALSTGEGQLSVPVTGENGVYLLEITSVTVPEEKDLETERRRLVAGKRARVNFEAFEALRKEAGVKDNRHQFF